MHNLSKEDIDHIFQKGTDKQEFPFKESSWDKMEIMLDARDRKRAIVKYTIAGVVVLLLSILSIYLYNSNNNQEIIKQTNSKPSVIADKTESLPSNSNLPNNKNQIRSNESNSIATDSNNDHKINLSNQSFSNNNSNQNFAKPLNDKRFGRSVINPISNQNKADFTLTNSINLNRKSKNSTIAYSPKEDNVSVKNESTKPILDFSVSELYEIKSVLPTLNIENLDFAIDPIEAKKVLTSKIRKSRFGFNLLASKEWSFVEDMSKSKSGYRLGADLAYQFGSKFQLSSGFIVSRKKFETVGQNINEVTFRSLGEFVGGSPETAKGSSTVFEIPLEFSYYFNNYYEDGFFVGLGVNSYLMADEWFDLEFHPDIADQNTALWTTKTKQNLKMNKHYFGLATAHFGYQKRISKNIAFQISPYVQLPLSGVGFADLKLVSTGIQMRMSFFK